jgi:hypothetical protein
MVRRQQKTTTRYYPYQLIAIGWWWKRRAIAQAAYHHLTSVLTKVNRSVQSVAKLECNSSKVNLYWQKYMCILGRHNMTARN